jgi:hypothetical protein
MRPLENAPARELERTPVSRRIGELAAASGLFLSHFEHRIHLPLPEHWLPEGRPDLGGAASWQGGVLAESKYQHFRHDSMVGSFHPAHRAAWTPHELCHRLVGWAWRPDATPLFHALAARLGEVLPTAVWYFFDEAHLRRCAAHAGRGPLFGAHCAPCERLAEQGDWPEDPTAEARLAQGRAFVARELDAVRRSMRTGRPEPHGWATLDLASDGLAYAAANADRLASREMHEFAEFFCRPGRGGFDSLEALADRVERVLEALLDGAPLEPWQATAATWAAQDLAWRLLTVRAECDDEPGDGLAELVGQLVDPGALAAVHAGYTALHDAFILPEPVDLFAVGYALPGVSARSVRQARTGLAEVLPATFLLLDDELDEVVGDFLEEDDAVRVPIARRFAGWLRRVRPGPIADLALYEAILAHPGPADAEALALGHGHPVDARRRLASGFEVVRFNCDVVSLATALEAPEGAHAAQPDEPPEVSESEHWLAIGRSGDEIVLTDVRASTAEALLKLAEAPADPVALGLARTEAAALEAAGVLVPAAWSLTTGRVPRPTR